jgi:hypothetical protein
MGRISPLAQHEQALLEWNAQGVERQEMARRLGVTTATVQAYLQRRKVRPVLSGPGGCLDEARLRDLLEVQRLTQPEAAAILECHTGTVERAVRRLRLKTARTGPRSGVRHHHEWEGGRYLDDAGYVLVFAPMHPQATMTAYVCEHRLLIEAVERRVLPPESVVHHLDNHPQHNWPSNLQMFASNADHLRQVPHRQFFANSRQSIPGVRRNNRTIGQCPIQLDTLAQCPSETILDYEWLVESYRPTIQHDHLARAELHRTGPWRSPYR